MLSIRLNILLFLLPALIVILSSCDKEEVRPQSNYTCDFVFADSSGQHPNASRYQQILEANLSNGMVGGTMMIKDAYGTWTGAVGMADLTSGAEAVACQPFLIASISKVFTAAAIMSYVEEGKLSLNARIADYLPAEVVEKVANVDQATISHLLTHTSGIPDYYTTALELARINNANNEWTQEDILAYTYGQAASNEVGETYYYCNTNFLLLGMILEKVGGKDQADILQERIFAPLNLESASFCTSTTVPKEVVQGYADIYDNGKITETSMVYLDELGTGDGSIAINAWDLGRFLEGLEQEVLISGESVAQMKEWFDLPEDWVWESLGQTKNGYGLEYFESDYGYAYGHTGGIDGFGSRAFYFPESGYTFVLLSNCVTAPIDEVYLNVLEVMFE
ncbi:MAG: serine hydrolase [Bacteroidetes bacterium]|nr:serine hydrolase [Bacteroidota bacterium]